ncbi:MAG: hypothetical protein ACXAC2_00020 [Candidatus Kariarchaeaceae archaeon]|jgi:hypothetical protein
MSVEEKIPPDEPADSDYKAVTKDQLVTMITDVKRQFSIKRDGNLNIDFVLYALLDAVQVLIKQNKEEEAILTDHETRIADLEKV